MQVQLLAIGARLPHWIETGFHEYAARLPRECRLRLREIPSAKRSKNTKVAPVLEQEAGRLLAAIPSGSHVIALDINGRAWSTEELAQHLDGWLQSGRNVALLVGGAEGLHANCLARADLTWSLSRLTFPHGLVRILVAEQLYRAWSILAHHPYHRA